MSDLLDTALILAQRDETNALIELLQNARRWRSTDSSGGGVRDLTGDQVIAALGYQPATQAEAGTGETTIKDALGYVPAQSEGGVGLSGNENNKLNIASAGVGKREVATELAGSGLAGGDGSPMAVDQTVARTDRDEVFSQDVAMDDGAGTGGLLRGEEGTVEVRKQSAPTQYGRLRASEVEVVDGNTATELRSQVVEISDSLLETNTDASADAWGGLYTYRGRKEDATGTGLISKGIAWSPAAERFGQVDVDARKNDSGENVGSGVQTSTFAPYARVNREESITKDWTFGGDIGTDDFVSRTTGWEINQQGYADFRKMWADELKVQAFTADVAQALAGTEVLTKSRATLAENFTVPPSGNSATLTVEDIDGQEGVRAFEAGDTVRLRVVDRSGGGLLVADVWGTVSGYTDNGGGTQSWTYSVVDDGAANGKVVYEGAVALDWGTSGDGQIYSTVLDDAGSPYTDVRTWSDSDGDDVPDSYDTFVRLGVLSGISGLSGEGLYTRRGRFTDDILIGSLDKSGEYLEADGGTVTLKGTLNIIGGDGVSNLNDAGALATEDKADYSSQVSGGPPSDATKGATWNTDLDGIPTRFGDAPEGSGLYATADHFGYYSGTNWASVLNSDGSGAFAGGAIQWDTQGRAFLDKSVQIGGRMLMTSIFEHPPIHLWHFDGSVASSKGRVPPNWGSTTRHEYGFLDGPDIQATLQPGRYGGGLAVEESTENLFDLPSVLSDYTSYPNDTVNIKEISPYHYKYTNLGGEKEVWSNFNVVMNGGQSYTQSFWIRGGAGLFNSDGYPNFDITFYSSTYGHDSGTPKVIARDGDWRHVSFTKIFDGDATLRPLDMFINSGTKWLEIKKPQLEQKFFGTSFVDGLRTLGTADFDIELPRNHSGGFWARLDIGINRRGNGELFRVQNTDTGHYIGLEDYDSNPHMDLQVPRQSGNAHAHESFTPTEGEWYFFTWEKQGDTFRIKVYGEDGTGHAEWTRNGAAVPDLDDGSIADFLPNQIRLFGWGRSIFDELMVFPYVLSEDEWLRIINADAPLQESPQSAASAAQDLAERYASDAADTAESNAKSYADGQIGALGGLDQIQDTTYIEGGLIDTGLLDADAVTADKLFVDKTMTENILAEDATITGTLTIGSGSSPGVIKDPDGEFMLSDSGLNLQTAGNKEGSSVVGFYDDPTDLTTYSGSLYANQSGPIIRGGDVIEINALDKIKMRYAKTLDLDSFLIDKRASDPSKTDLDPNQGMFYILTDLQTGIAEVKVAIRNDNANGDGDVYYGTLVKGTF